MHFFIINFLFVIEFSASHFRALKKQSNFKNISRDKGEKGVIHLSGETADVLFHVEYKSNASSPEILRARMFVHALSEELKFVCNCLLIRRIWLRIIFKKIIKIQFTCLKSGDKKRGKYSRIHLIQAQLKRETSDLLSLRLYDFN